MFKKLFKKKSKEKSERSKEDQKIIDDALAKVIAEKTAEDPLFGMKVVAKELVELSMILVKDDNGVQVETLLVLLASAAGYACQESVRYKYITKGDKSENDLFTIMGCEDGKTYFYGDLINEPIMDDPYSIWRLAAGAAEEAGVKELVDVREIFAYVSSTLCQDDFGTPRLPKEQESSLNPTFIVKNVYPKYFVPLLKSYFENSTYWPIIFGLAIQNVILMAKETIDPNLALKVVMECSISMSKINIDDIK